MLRSRGFAVGISSRLFVASFCRNYKFCAGSFFTGVSDKNAYQTLKKPAFFRLIEQEVYSCSKRKRFFSIWSL